MLLLYLAGASCYRRSKKMIVHRKIHVRGKVQGVYFRASARVKAEELDIKGWVRNEPDGSVAMAAEGEAAAMESFIGWCRQGPPAAVVSEVDVSEGALQYFETFSMLR